jgi:hypothetical protein
MSEYIKVSSQNFRDIYNLYESYRDYQFSKGRDNINRELTEDELRRLWGGEKLYHTNISNVELYNHPLKTRVGYAIKEEDTLVSYIQYSIDDRTAHNEFVFYNYGDSKSTRACELLMEYTFSTLRYQEGCTYLDGYMGNEMANDSEFSWFYQYADRSSQRNSGWLLEANLDNLL